MVIGLLVVLLPTVTSMYYAKGRYYIYRYLYTGFSFSYPRFPSGASGKAVIEKVWVRGELHYVLYDDRFFYHYEWEEF
jgi:hypothetical protein